MLKHNLLIWMGFALCLAVVLAAMGWVSLAAVRSERAEAETRRQADLEEKVRLALWRIDSTLAPLVAQESVRPWFCYRSFFPAQRLDNQLGKDRGGGGMLVPSPLLTASLPQVVVHFQFEPDGRLTSPQVPAAADRKLAVPRYATLQRVRRAERELAEVGAAADRGKLLAMLPRHAAEPLELVQSPLVQPPEQRLAQQRRRAELQQNVSQGAVEYDVRTNMLLNAGNMASQAQQQQLAMPAGALPATDMSGTPLTPLWIGGRLLLVRRVAVGGRDYVQGCLLNWPVLRKSLLETIEDLLPAADLQAVTAGPPREEAHLVAALPLRLVPHWQAGDETAGRWPIFVSLAIAWACVLLAAAAVAGLLAGVMRLSARRASFVSAVTHELRTPLTTFQMYAEMLAEGMVPEGPRQKQYFDTLRTEAGRLVHLVENVLAYARLERGRTDRRSQLHPLGQLVQSLQRRLGEHAGRAGMELVVEGDDAARNTAVRANASAVEQILFNLVDNACKYAAAASDKRIHLLMWRGKGVVELCVQDHGPGVSRPSRGLFRSFSKSAREAAHSAPGIGLGLALSRRLARGMGGDLRLETGRPEGARLVLTLPTA